MRGSQLLLAEACPPTKPATCVTQGIHVFLAYNGSVCMTSCKAPEGPLCQAACQYDDLARMFNSYIQAEQVRNQSPDAWTERWLRRPAAVQQCLYRWLARAALHLLHPAGGDFPRCPGPHQRHSRPRHRRAA